MGNLLWYVAVILFLGWILGFVGFGAALGNFVHILLVLAVIVVLIRLISGRKPV